MKADCHMHMILDGVHWKSAIARHSLSPDIPWIRSILDIYHRLGYTYLRDGGDRWGAGAAARQLAPEYGIHYATPLAPLCAAGHYGSFIGEVFSNLQEYTHLVRQHRKQGADFIKIMISGLMDFDQAGLLTEEGLPPALIGEMIHIAHEEGFAVMAHCNGARTMEAAAVAGVDSIEHGAYPDTVALQSMVDNGVIWVPTLSTVGNLRGKGRFDEQAVQAIFHRAVDSVSQFAKMGGIIAPGTDAGAWAVPHGCETEESLLYQAGVDPSLLEQGMQAIIKRFF